MRRAVLKQQAKQLLRRTVGEPYVGKRIKLRRLAQALPPLRLQPTAILDAGAEDATFVYWLADRYPGAQVTAVDLDAAAIAACLAARPAAYRESVHFEVGSFDTLRPASFDLITAFDVLEHITDDHGAVADLVRALRPGGTLLVHVPRDRWLERSGTVHQVPDADAWQINPGHVRQGYSPQSMRTLLEGAGLEVLDLQTWVGHAGTFAHEFYARVEHPVPLRALSLPVTDWCARLDRRRGGLLGNTVYAQARKPA
ncbi:class I SAM-dependent methyltransferase [Jatrophihabitans sp.]|uniref:class I SAM-dependent methyltransferase n=1 Tax=Jatrophihabitans sp. TaxID=1932789 RepID=UPI0030C6CBDC|nr:Methyltransferase type 11 [Jatrophihabitans sp.]